MKNKGNVVLDTFLDFAGVSNYLKHLNFLHGKEVIKYLLNYKSHRLHIIHFVKLLQSSTKDSKNCNPPAVRIVFTGH